MYSAFSGQLAQSRVADLHRQAKQDALAATARQGRRALSRQPAPRVRRLPALAVRRLRTAWGTHS